MMQKIVIVIAFISLALFSTTVLPALANNNNEDPLLAWRDELQKCNATGNAIVNVTQIVKNDADSGIGSSTAWAFDNYVRHIRVWPVGGNTYCATVAYNGEFNAVAGHLGPGGSGTIGANVKGDMEGGYRTTVFTGTLLSTPLWPTSGSVGTFDYGCDANFNCPGIVDWKTRYFSSTSDFGLTFWGWIYQANDNHGTWINACDDPSIPACIGNSGNIL